jgi:hypothetical protein
LAILGVAPFVLLISSIQRDVWWQETKSAGPIASGTYENGTVSAHFDFTTKITPFRYNTNEMNFNIDLNVLNEDVFDENDAPEEVTDNESGEKYFINLLESGFEKKHPNFSDEGDTIGSDENDFCGTDKEEYYGDACCKHFRTIQNIMIAAVVFAFCAWVLFLWFISRKGAPMYAKWASVALYIICGSLSIAAIVSWGQEFKDFKCLDINTEILVDVIDDRTDGVFLNLKPDSGDSKFLVGFYLACVGGGLTAICALCVAMAHRFIDFERLSSSVSQKVTASVNGLVF